MWYFIICINSRRRTNDCIRWKAMNFTCIQDLLSYFLSLLLLFDSHLHHNLKGHSFFIKKQKSYHRLFRNKAIRVQYFVHYHNQHRLHNHIHLDTKQKDRRKNQYLIWNWCRKKGNTFMLRKVIIFCINSGGYDGRVNA